MNRRSVAAALAVTVVTAAMLVTKSAKAAPSARLVYVREKGAEKCPDEAAVRAAVIMRLGYDPFRPEAIATLFAEVRRDAGAFHGRVKLVDEDNVARGARELDHPRCAELVDAMALTMSIAIDPRSLVAPLAPVAQDTPSNEEPATESPDPTPAPLPLDVPVPVRVRVPARVPVQEQARPPASPPPHFFASLSPTATFGSAPATAIGLVGSFGLQSRPFSLAVEARGDLPSATDVPRGTVSTSLFAATLAPCFLRGIATVCALGSVGRLLAEARGIQNPRSDSALHALGGGRVGVAESLTKAVELRANADVLYALTPQVLQIDGQEAYTLPRLSVQLALGVAIHFF